METCYKMIDKDTLLYYIVVEMLCVYAVVNTLLIFHSLNDGDYGASQFSFVGGFNLKAIIVTV